MSAEEPVKKKLKTVYDFSRFQVENSHFEKLPNEILLKIVDYLHIGDLLRCGQVCRKARTVVHDESLWKKVNFSSDSLVPTGLLKLVLEHGCEYLNITDQLVGHLNLNQDSKLKFLNLDLNSCNVDVIIDPLMSSCHSLEKLQLTNFNLNSSLIKSISTQNSKTLKVLKLNLGKSQSSSRPYMQLSVIQPIIDHCVELEELTFCQTRLTKLSIDYLVKNITPKVSKLCLCNNRAVRDEHICILVGRCANLTELHLKNTSINSLDVFIEKLQFTLEKLSLSETFLTRGGNKLFELKAMKKLKVLDLHQKLISDQDFLKLDNLRRQLRNVEISHMLPEHVAQGWEDNTLNFRRYE